ncbi:MAG: site-specific integrase [Candidatus Sedimenticola sp. (ex Thyasira tokunagai)]
MPSGKHQFIVRKKGQKPIYKTFKKKAVGERWAREQEAAIEAKTYIDTAKAEKLSIYAMLKRYREEVTDNKENSNTKSSETSRIATLQDRLEGYTLAALSPDIIVDFGVGRIGDDEVSADSVRRELTLLQSAVNRARHIWKIKIPINPVPEAREALTMAQYLTPGKKRDRRLTEKEAKALLSYPHKQDTLINEVVEFAIETAMRRGEIAALKRTDINKAGCIAIVRASKTDKKTGWQGRDVPLSARALEIYKSLPTRIDRSVFGLTARSISQAFKRMVDDLGIEDLRFHDLRHEATSRLFEKGLSIEEVATVTGHADWKSLKRYTHPNKEKVAAKL